MRAVVRIRSGAAGIALLGAVVAAGCGTGDPCDGQAGACLTIDLSGKLGAVEAMQIDLAMAVDHTFTRAMPPGVTALPVQVGVLLPEVTGKVLVRAVALAGDKPVGLGMAAVDVTPGAHARVSIVMAPAAGASCNDGFRDGAETDVDCGGACGPCAVGQRCAAMADCGQNLCGPDKKCVAASCTDKAKNGRETDVDCGGGDCGACDDGRACKAPADCKSASCAGNLCKAAACDDGVKNGGEVDVDCGGPCGPCRAGKACAVAKDCLSGRCEMMKCVALDLAFAAPLAYVTGTGPFTLVTGDWNGDGKTDVATLNQSSFSVSVLLNAGKGGALLGATSYNVAMQPRGLVAGDWNGDGKADLLSIPSSGVPTVLTGKGDGTFMAVAQTAQVQAFAAGGAAGDFDGDGKTDIALLYPSQGVQFLQGMGNGAFAWAGNNQGAQGTLSFAAADWNGDGRVDLAIGQSYTDLNNNQVHRVAFFAARALQPGKFDFNQVGTITLPAAPQSLTAADVNGDKRSDLLVTYGGSQSSIGLALGEARNQNLPAALTALPLIGGARLVNAGDYNGDGKIDLVAASAAQNSWVAWSGNGDGTFAMPPTFAPAPSQPGPAVVADLAGDGKPELLAIVGATLAVYPEGGLMPAAVYDPSNAQARAPALGDLNGDGKLDLVLAGAKGLTVALGKGDGALLPPVVVPSVVQASSVVLRDVNEDKKLDAVVGSGTGSTIFVHPGAGDGTFQTPLQLAVGNVPAGVAVGDLNGDGHPDIATANVNSNDVTVLWNSGGAGMGGLFPMSNNLALTMGGPGSLAIADVTGDGNPDLVVPLPSGTNLAILAGNGKGSFAMPTLIAVGQRPVAVVTGDWNGDGRIDIATANQIGGTASVLLGNGNGMFLAAVNHPVGVNPTSIASFDFNLDGRPDLVVGNYASHSASVLLGDANAGFQPATGYLVGMQPALAAGDLNGDGKADLVTANANLGNVCVVLNQSR